METEAEIDLRVSHICGDCGWHLQHLCKSEQNHIAELWHYDVLSQFYQTGNARTVEQASFERIEAETCWD